MPRALALVLPATVAAIAVTSLVAMAQQGGAARATAPAPKFATPAAKPALFFRESWRQPAALDASTEWDAAFPVTPAAVTNPDLELKVYDPNAKRIPEYAKAPPPGSLPRDWIGTSCVILSGYNQNPGPDKVVHGDPPIRRTCGRGPVARWR